MGADLYIQSVFNTQKDSYQTEFDSLVDKRESLRQAGNFDEAELTQKEVLRVYNLMYDKGYFRDSYNSSNLLWQFNLDWWGTVGSLLDDEGYLHPEDAQHLLSFMANNETQFANNLKQIDLGKDETRADITQYFQDKYEQFKAFLNHAIELNEAILCSI